MKRSEIKDRKGREIWAGDTLRFVNKRQWYGPITTDLGKLPYEERIVHLPRDYDWLLSSEVQHYWEIVKRPKHKRKP